MDIGETLNSQPLRPFTIKIPCTLAPALTFFMQPLCSLLWDLMEATVGLLPPPVVISNVSFTFLGDLSLSKYNESLRSVFKIGIFIWVYLILFISTLLYVWKLPKFRVEKNTFFFLPTKSITSAIGTVTRGLHFNWMNTENKVNTPQERIAIPDWKKRGEWRGYLELKSIKSRRWHQNDF